MSTNFNAGEFYGHIPKKRVVADLTLSEVIHRNQVNLPGHSHELASFTLLLAGSYSERFGKKDFSYRPMNVWWHPSGIYHKDEVGKTGGRFFTVEIQPAGMESFRQVAKSPEMFVEKNSSLVWLACRLYAEFNTWQVCSEMVAEGITLEMLAFSARRNIKSGNHPPAWLQRVVERLNEEFDRNISTTDLANEAGVHPVYLASVFRKFHNETMGEYLQKLRVSRASEMLLDWEIPLSEIACMTGFSDQSHFSRIFKRYVGTSPGKFRNSLR